MMDQVQPSWTEHRTSRGTARRTCTSANMCSSFASSSAAAPGFLSSLLIAVSASTRPAGSATWDSRHMARSSAPLLFTRSTICWVRTSSRRRTSDIHCSKQDWL
eukprot:GHUV01033262.1.p2 GENE.GHUV01033262.1~~GHUV01033262.1.p2  ORF type:complete len:104 (+),score=28.93 GHUV01033262.1:415-726(+)